jgi:hypothetical protein
LRFISVCRSGLQQKKGERASSNTAKAIKAAHVKGLVNRVNAKRAAVEEAEKAGGNAKKARRGGRSRSSAEAAEDDELEAGVTLG